MQTLIKVRHDNNTPTVSARELYHYLEPEGCFTRWMADILTRGYLIDEDFSVCDLKDDYRLSLQMAAEICVLQGGARGLTARRYLAEVERGRNTPEMLLYRALKEAREGLGELQRRNEALPSENAAMRAKADYFDELVSRGLLTNFRQTAKELRVQEREFINYLLEKKYIYRDTDGRLMPYARKNKGLFQVKECFNEQNGWSGIQTMITPKGRDTFRLLCTKAS